MIHNFVHVPEAAPDEREWEVKIDGAAVVITVWNDARTASDTVRIERAGHWIRSVAWRGREWISKCE